MEQSINLIPFDKFSYYQKLLRVTAYVLRLFPSHESYRTVDGIIAYPVEIDEAERHLQHLVQGESFNTERKDLLDNKSVKKSSRIAHFTPFIGPHGLIRSSSRLRRLVENNFDTKHPIVMDARHTSVKLFLRHTHLKNHHQGIDYLGSKIQERYAILKLRSTLHSIKSNCVFVESFAQQPFTSHVRPPKGETCIPPPLTNTGVDYFRTFDVTVRRTTEKMWGLLFTCLTTRAVHVEVVTSMDTSSCVMGVERFVSRRGSPAMIWSDNGTNFIGEEKELRECMEKWKTLNIATELAHKQFKWELSGGSIHPVRHTKVASGRG